MTESPVKENLQLTLEEMRLQMAHVYQFGDALDQKANFLLAGAGIVVGFATVLHSRLDNASPLKLFILSVSVVSYIAMIVTVLLAMAPRKYHLALKADYDDIKQSVLIFQPDKALTIVLRGYTERIDLNLKINACKAKAVYISMFLFAWILLLLFLAVFA